MPDQKWIVMVTGEDMIDDIRKAPDEYLEFLEAFNEFMQTDYTMGKPIRINLYHFDVVKTTLTRNISARFSDVRDEIVTACAQEIPATKDWVSYPALSTALKVVCRTTNRFLVGLPLCRVPDYVNLNIEFAGDVFKAAGIITLFPDFLQPIVGTMVSPLEKTLRRAMGHLGPIIQDRMNDYDQYDGDWPDKPNDLITWLLDENPQGEYRTVRDLMMRVLEINLAAIHPTSMLYTNSLFQLAIQPPEVVAALRGEIESVVKQYGWTKVAVGHLHLLDSFMKEVSRLMGTNASVIDRKVLKDFTFSDGTTVPAGYRIAVPGYALHRDKVRYQDASKFKPFRFADMRSKDGEGIKHHMFTPSPDFLSFGTGKHACPGRFFSVNSIKSLFAHTLLTYDVKLESDKKEIPEPVWFGRDTGPNRTAKILFRKRKFDGLVGSDSEMTVS
ncbi:cytochrome P450 [Dendrothele bispora CBS 962.96]|uniref:Cytochrome P450 n=1 Tax=Dendrothele bispora (strain CBS 962.96) TaxID=1314807 RepID=A0A4V4HEL9_DENBC|nr:cytochrome P450 [Dendrothele bispora CBS 962.96]